MKAFDRTSHSFLFSTLEHFRFGPHFIRWIKLIYNSVSSSVKVNGWLTSFITLSRGLRQGCALSMPLYVLTAEILTLRIRSNPRIHGITPPGSNIQVKLSQYAENTTFTLRDDTSIQETFHILSLYESASGAKINLQNAKDFGPGLLNTALTNFLILTGIILISPKKFSGPFLETSIVPVST